MKFLSRKACLTWLLAIFSASLPAQESRIVFSHLDVNNGLSDNRIKCMIRDKNGFMWFGTSSGLNRFDGYEFEIYAKSNTDSISLYDNDINGIVADKEGNLWIATRSGVCILDINTYRVRRIDLLQYARQGCQDVNYSTAIASDYQGNIWIGTHSGIFFYNAEKKVTEHILFDNSSCTSPFNNISAISRDRDGGVWIGTINGYIFRYNLLTSTVEKIESQGLRPRSGNSVRFLFPDNAGVLWVVGSDGLFRFDIRKRTWKTEGQSKLDEWFRNVQVTGINQDSDGTIWIITDGRGLFLLDLRSFRISNLLSRQYSEGGLSSNGLVSNYIDESGISWIGTTKKGVDFYKKNIRKFQLIRSYPSESNCLPNNDVNSIAEDAKGNLWIGTNGGGLSYHNRETGSFTNYNSSPGLHGGLSSNYIATVFVDSRKRVWAGTYLGGLNCLDPVTGSVKIYRTDVNDSTSISDNSVWGICEDNDKNLWFATLTNGLNLFNEKSGKFRRYQSGNSSLSFDYLNSVITEKNDNLWISSSNGLIYFNPRQNMSVWYTNTGGNATSISDNHISSVFEDSRGLFWVCTSNGLNLMDRKNNTFRSFGETEGLPSSNVLRVLEDRNHDLWISTKNGLSRLTISQTERYNSQSFTFRNFTISDGLQGKEYNETAALAASDGTLYFGGPDGLNSFNPSEIEEDTIATRTVFTRLRIFNNIVRPGEKYGKRIILDKPLCNTKEITLHYRENAFTIDFAALNYFYPERTRYSYRLEGFSSTWVSTEGNKNFANYSNLNQGTYRFVLRSTNSSGIWNKEEIVMKIRILPPFWKSWFAYILYFFLGLGTLVYLRIYTLERERNKMKLEQERMEAQHTHEIDSLKLKFFTNISHEFRTPLTLILAPIDNLMMTWKGRDEEKHLKTIRQNARRLLLMVNQLLDFRKLEMQGFRYSPSRGDIIIFLREVVDSFSDLSGQRKINLSFHSSIDSLNTTFDKDKLEKIIFNLLSNAFKFVAENGRVSVRVSYEKDEAMPETEDGVKFTGRLVIEVEDNGIGIPSDRLNDIFTRSYVVETPGLADQGNGIGLSLVNEFVRLHQGEVAVRSQEGKGSTFTVTIPVVAEEPSAMEQDDHLPDTEMTSDKPVVLIAEDNEDLRHYLRDNLSQLYSVVEAPDGKEALKKIRKRVPDLIVSDIMMPGMNGIELCKRVRGEKDFSHIPFILLTARYTDEQQIEGIEAGADDYITKPFNLQILLSKIDNALLVRKNIKELFRNKLNFEPSNIEITSLDEQFLQKAVNVVEKNIASPDFTVEEMSRDLGMSRTLLYKRILALTGKSPVEFIRLLRLKRAAVLLEKSQLNVSEVTYRVGFKDPKYFRKLFLQEFGVLPSKFSEDSGKNDD